MRLILVFDVNSISSTPPRLPHQVARLCRQFRPPRPSRATTGACARRRPRDDDLQELAREDRHATAYFNRAPARRPSRAARISSALCRGSARARRSSSPAAPTGARPPARRARAPVWSRGWSSARRRASPLVWLRARRRARRSQRGAVRAGMTKCSPRAPRSPFLGGRTSAAHGVTAVYALGSNLSFAGTRRDARRRPE